VPINDGAVLITGGTGVVGVGVVRRLVRDGQRVALCYSRNLNAVEGLRAELGVDALRLFAVQSDLAERGAVEQLIADLDAADVPVTALVHSAALVDHTSIDNLTAERFARVLAVNVTAAFLLVRELARREGFRAAVLVSSIGAEFTGMGSAAYEASKGAVDSLTRALAAELAPRVRVNAVAPGVVRSHRTEGDSEFSSATLAARVPEGRLAEPDDVAATVRFLLGEESRYIAGQVLRVDGGLSLRVL